MNHCLNVAKRLQLLLTVSISYSFGNDGIPYASDFKTKTTLSSHFDLEVMTKIKHFSEGVPDLSIKSSPSPIIESQGGFVEELRSVAVSALCRKPKIEL